MADLAHLIDCPTKRRGLPSTSPWLRSRRRAAQKEETVQWFKLRREAGREEGYKWAVGHVEAVRS